MILVSLKCRSQFTIVFYDKQKQLFFFFKVALSSYFTHFNLKTKV